MTDSKANEKAGYKNHVEGSRKGKVHELYDKQGADAAWTLGLKLKLKESSLRSWFSRWGAPAKVSKSAAKVTKPKPAPKAKVAKVKPDVKPDSGAPAAAA
jgi:hypothetical protein